MNRIFFQRLQAASQNLYLQKLVRYTQTNSLCLAYPPALRTSAATLLADLRANQVRVGMPKHADPGPFGGGCVS